MLLSVLLLVLCGSRSLVRDHAKKEEQGRKDVDVRDEDNGANGTRSNSDEEEEEGKVRLSAQNQLLVNRITDQILLSSHDIDDRFKAETLQGTYSNYFEDALSKWFVLNLPFLASDAGFIARSINEKLAQAFVDKGSAYWVKKVGLKGQDDIGRGMCPCAVPALVSDGVSRDLINADPPCNEALKQTLHEAIDAASTSETWRRNGWKWNYTHLPHGAPVRAALVEDRRVSSGTKTCAVHAASQNWGSVHMLLKEAANSICSARRNSRASVCHHGRRPSHGSCPSMLAAYAVKYRLCGVLCSMREIADINVNSCEDFAVSPPTGFEADQALVQLGGNCTEDID